jgi:hypothetical protein
MTEMSKRMSKQEFSPSSLSGNSEESIMKEGRYYVQALTERIFLVRECQASNGKPGADDRIVRAFDARYDAYHYANSMNE